jgi:hypothetical protein
VEHATGGAQLGPVVDVDPHLPGRGRDHAEFEGRGERDKRVQLGGVERRRGGHPRKPARRGGGAR